MTFLDILTIIFFQAPTSDYINAIKEVGLFPLFAIGCLWVVYKLIQVQQKTIKEKDSYIKTLHAEQKKFAEELLLRQDVFIEIAEKNTIALTEVQATTKTEVALLNEIKGFFQNHLTKEKV